MTVGRVRRGWLGIAGQNRPLPRDLARRLELAGEGGVEVMSFVAQGPAAAAGLREGDVIVRLGEQSIGSVDDIHRVLNGPRSGQALPVRVLRQGKLVDLGVTPAEAP
jgi:S1-C subfamily serine protease